MANKIYPGISLFIANKDNKHNYFANTRRPFLSCCITDLSGDKTYYSPFLTNDPRVSILITESKAATLKVPANHSAILVPNDMDKPLFSQLVKA